MITPSPEKSRFQWILEWIGSIILFLAIVAATILVFTITISVDGTVNWMIAWIFLILLGIACFILFFKALFRTIGMAMMLAYPAKEGLDISLLTDEISITLRTGRNETFQLDDVKQIIINERFEGIFIKSRKTARSYTLPTSFKELESQLDNINTLEKRVEYTESKNGRMKRIYYSPKKGIIGQME